MVQLRQVGRTLIEGASRPPADHVAYFAHQVCPRADSEPPRNLTTTVAVSSYTPGSAQPGGTTPAGLPRLPIGEISQHSQQICTAEAGQLVESSPSSSDAPCASSEPQSPPGAEADAPVWQGRAVDSVAEVQRRMEALSSAYEQEQTSRYDVYKRQQDYESKAVACRWAEDQVLRNNAASSIREVTKENLLTAKRLHKDGVRLSVSAVDSDRTADHSGRYGQMRTVQGPYRPTVASSRAGAPPSSSIKVTAATAVNSFFSRKYPSGFESIGN